MKTWLIAGALLAVAATNGAPTRTEQDRLLSEARQLVAQENYAEAEPRLQQLTELQPDNPYLRQTLADVKAKREAEQQDPGRFLRKQLEQIRLAEVNCRETSPADAVAALFKRAKETVPDKREINYVWLVPPDAKLSPVTLSLRNIPLADALRYVTELAGLRYRVDAKAVIIYQPESAPAKNAQPQ